MDQQTAIILFQTADGSICADLEIPLHISADDLAAGLNQAFHLGMDPAIQGRWFLTAENPMVLLQGSTSLAEYGIRNGSTIFFTGSS